MMAAGKSFRPDPGSEERKVEIDELANPGASGLWMKRLVLLLQLYAAKEKSHVRRYRQEMVSTRFS
jgi:hypothetical protein